MTPACCGGKGGRHTARLNFQSDIEGWYAELFRTHPGLHMNLPMWQYGPPQEIIGGSIMRVIHFDGPVEVGVHLGEKPFPNFYEGGKHD